MLPRILRLLAVIVALVFLQSVVVGLLVTRLPIAFVHPCFSLPTSIIHGVLILVVPPSMVVIAVVMTIGLFLLIVIVPTLIIISVITVIMPIPIWVSITLILAKVVIGLPIVTL